MRVAVLVNPTSGAGRSMRQAGDALAGLRGAGHQAELIESRPGSAEGWLPEHLGDAELLVVVGGDGSVRQVCGLAADRRLPIYQLPGGTENLFGREFGMSQDVGGLVRALEQPRFRDVDVAQANGEHFLLMASVGLDAEVVHDLARRRGRSISHLSYLGPIIRQLRHWRPARLEVSVDGRRIDSGGPGMVVVANCGRYAGRLDPCGWADMTDGKFSVAYLPTTGQLAALGWIWRCAWGRQRAAPGFVTQDGSEIMIQAVEPFHYQLDGDPPAMPAQADRDGSVHRGVTQLRLTIRHAALPVLLPA